MDTDPASELRKIAVTSNGLLDQVVARLDESAPASGGSLSAELRKSLSHQWTYHIGRCNECKGYPTLCQRGKNLHQQLHPEDWDCDKPTR